MEGNRGVITVVGRRKLCMAHAGDEPLPAITRMAWGNGGVDEDGQPKPATGNEIGLYNELMNKAIEKYEYIGEDKSLNTDKAWEVYDYLVDLVKLIVKFTASF